jgi:hypothetical protein
VGQCEEGEREVTVQRGGRAGCSARARGDGTARRCAEAEHAHVLQAAARVPATAASREGHAGWTLSVRRCLG